MRFLAGSRLWLLFLVGVAALAVAWFERRRVADIERFTDPEMLGWLTPRQPGWRSVAAMIAFLLTLATLIVAAARPARSVQVPVKVATVMVALDKSTSMSAQDVAPSRISAARAAAIRFVRELPQHFRVGLVLFAQTANVEVAPTDARTLTLNAISHVQLDDGTAIGDAIFTSLDALTQDAGLTTRGTANRPKYPRLRAAAVVLLSDGATNSGHPNNAAAAAAQAAGVPVSTIGFGTPNGKLDTGEAVPVDNQALQAIAQRTGGQFFRAESQLELQSVFQSLGLRLTYRSEAHEITQWFVGSALALAMVTALLSLTWFSRLP